jgi:hypothetical protein
MDFCDDFDIICMKMWENNILYRRILNIMKEHIYTIKALMPNVLPESDYLPIYATFQSYPTFLGKKTPQKQAVATLKNSKTQACSSGEPNTPRHTHRGLHPYTPSLKRTPSQCTLFSDTKGTLVKSL